MQNQEMFSDSLDELGALALGSRLRRLADTLYKQAAQSLRAEQIDLSPNHIPVLMTLHKHGTLSVVVLAKRLKSSQPGITRMVADLQQKDIVTLTRSPVDQRQTDISLSSKGTHLLADISADYCRRVEQAATELFVDAAPDFLNQLKAIEVQLSQSSLDARIAKMRKA